MSHQDDVKLSHSQTLLPAVASLMDQANLSFSQLDAIAVVVGPGSFTGLRIGIAAAQGIAFAHQLPVISVSSLALIAARYQFSARSDSGSAAEVVLATMDARMGELYCGWYDITHDLPKLLGSEEVLKPDALSQIGWPVQVDRGSPWQCEIAIPFDDVVGKTDHLLITGTGLVHKALFNNKYNMLIQPDSNHSHSLDADALLHIAAILFQQGHAAAAEELLPVYLRNQVTS